MSSQLRKDAQRIIDDSIAAVLPDAAVARALKEQDFSSGKLILVSIGKAAWQMAKAAQELLQDRIDDGIVITKYHHIQAEIPGLRLREAGHPVPDANSFAATQEAINLVSHLTAQDQVLFLISGGGSALFEKPLIPEEELSDLTQQLLASGADITEMNTLRKRLSAVKGGKFAQLCQPARVVSIILSDIIGDPLDMIASGPAYPDQSTCQQALEIADRYQLRMSPLARQLLSEETPKVLSNVTSYVNGSVRELCSAAARSAQALGYQPVILSDCLCCEAREAGSFLASIAQTQQKSQQSLAYIAGGETLVHLRGKGLGGRNQELALAAAIPLSSMRDTALFSVGSDGTDGPTDAAGGYVDQDSLSGDLSATEVKRALAENDTYHALKQSDGLIITGATGTNVNDVAVLLIKRH